MTFGQGQRLPSLNHSVTSFGFFHICAPLAVLFPCTGQCVREIVKRGLRLLESQRPFFLTHHTDFSASVLASGGGNLPHRIVWRSKSTAKCENGTDGTETVRQDLCVMGLSSLRQSLPVVPTAVL